MARNGCLWRSLAIVWDFVLDFLRVVWWNDGKMSGDYRLVRQRGSPFWYADFLVWDAVLRDWRRKFTSTKKRSERAAAPVASKMAAAAVAVAGGAEKGWSRESALALLNELEITAGLPETVVSKSWKEFSAEWLRLRAPLINESSLAAYTNRVRAFNRWAGARAARSLDTFTGEDLQAFYQWLLNEGRLPTTAGTTMATNRGGFEGARH